MIRVIGFGCVLLCLSACGNGADEPGSSGQQQRSWPSRSRDLLSAIGHYGPLVVREGEIEVESATKPWSSWWFPARETWLFQGDTTRVATLEKYDRYVQKTKGVSPQAALYERENLYDPGANAWEGLCNAWATASLMEQEPTRPVTSDGITFGVGDLKALLIKSHEQLEGLRYFGQRFNGDRKGIYDDLYPDQFHRILQAELIERGRPFIMDKDPGVPVWNTPVWKAQIKIDRDSGDPSVMHVTSWIFGASPFVDTYDYVGTLAVVFEYTYDLFGEPQDDGSFLVGYGMWTGLSLDFHPDFVTIIPENKVRASNNQKIDVQTVDKLAALSARK